MPRGRRFTKEQRKRMQVAREKQRRACIQGRHTWWPDHRNNYSGAKGIEPQYWTTEQRYPMPTWNKKTIVCPACGKKGALAKLNIATQKRVREIFTIFIENTKSLRKRRESEQALKGE